MRAPLAILAALAAFPALGQDVTAGNVAFSGINRAGIIQSAINPGLVTGAGKAVTVTVAGLKAGDAALVTSAGTTLSLGVGIGSARVTADNTLEVTVLTTIGLGLTLGSIPIQVVYFGP